MWFCVQVGGATGLIGDPSGRSSERTLLSPEEIEFNVAGIRQCIHRVVANTPGLRGRVLVLNNADWVSGLSFIQVMRDIGKHFRVGTMLSRDSVKGRMAGDGMSYTGAHFPRVAQRPVTRCTAADNSTPLLPPRPRRASTPFGGHTQSSRTNCCKRLTFCTSTESTAVASSSEAPTSGATSWAAAS